MIGDSTLSLFTLAQNAGFSDSDAVIASAIAMAESSGNPNAIGDLTLGRSIGLWQINLRAHPEYQESQLYDPQFNAMAAFRVYQQQGWNAWSAFKNGNYRKFLPTADAQPPITIDANTGQVVPDDSSSSFSASVYGSPAVPAPPSAPDNFSRYLIWGLVGIAALWLFEEVSG